MEGNNVVFTVVVVIVMLHFIAGFGYLLWKLRPPKDGTDDPE